MWPREASPKELPMSIPILIGHAHFLLPTPISTHDAQYTQFQLIPVAFYSTYEKGPYRAINDF